jgi:hypothetical protein
LRAKSLLFYMDKFAPPYAIRTSLGNYKIDNANKIIDMPLYAVEKIDLAAGMEAANGRETHARG